MRLVSFRESGVTRVGSLAGDFIVDFSARNPRLNLDMLTLIERWEQLSDDEVQSLKLSSPALPLQSVELLSPIPCPKRNLFCVGKNYVET